MESFQKYVSCEKGERVDRKSDKVTLGIGKVNPKIWYHSLKIFVFRFSATESFSSAFHETLMIL